MKRVHIPVLEIEFVEGGNTLWIHGPDGGTVFRLKVTGAITSKRCSSTISPSHADAVAHGDIVFCLGRKAKTESRNKKNKSL